MSDGACTLCGLPTPDPPVTGEGADGAFCCRGCLAVARTLDDVEAADAGDARAALDRGPDAEDGTVTEQDGETAYLAGESAGETAYPTGESAGETAYLTVDGMHCATCEAFIEARATDQEGVLAASASYPADAVRVVYDPGALDGDDLSDLLSGTGYRARVREDGSESEDGSEETTARLLLGAVFGMMVMLWYVLFLYPAYLGVDPSLRLFDVEGPAGAYLLGNVWVMGTIVVGYTGYPIFRGAYVSLRAGQPNMDLLVGLAAGAAYVYSTVAIVLGHTEVYFDVAVVVVLAVTVGTHVESRAKKRAAGRLADLTRARVDEARRRVDGRTETVALDRLAAGDEVVVRPGERVPVDGTVVDGAAGVDLSLVTGESIPERVEPGDEVVGGARVTDGALVVRVAPGAESTLDRLTTLLWDVQAARPGVQRLVDRLAAVFVPLVVVLAVVSAGGHLLLGAAPTDALLIGLAVLVVSCPCALGLATPLATAAGVRAALDRGIVVTDATTFERAPETDVVVFDKTGTLTTGEMRVSDVVVAGDAGGGDDASADSTAGEAVDAPTVAARAAAVEQFADHPVAAAIVDRAGVPDVDVSGFRRHPGRGASALVAGERVLVGSPALFESEGVAVPDDLRERCGEARDAGQVPALVGWDGRARGVVVAGDDPRPEWPRVVDALAADRRVVVLTGDSPEAASAFADHPGVDDVFAGVPPEAKAEVVERLRAEGTVAMVGDGHNDAPALAAADLGVALERGTRLAADAADAVVTTDDLTAVPALFELTGATDRRVTENLGWALLYNAIAVPLAVAGVLNPAFAAVAMATSSLLVVGNAARPLGVVGVDGPGDDERTAHDAGTDLLTETRATNPEPQL